MGGIVGFSATVLGRLKGDGKHDSLSIGKVGQYNSP